MDQPLFIKSSHGFVVLFIVIIMGSASLALSLWMTTSSFWSIVSNRNDTKSHQARAYANACAELALENMRNNNNFIGASNGIIDGNICNYSVSNLGGNNRSIAVSADVGTVTRRLQIYTSGFNPIIISSWKDVSL